jgi:hypothetical protein
VQHVQARVEQQLTCPHHPKELPDMTLGLLHDEIKSQMGAGADQPLSLLKPRDKEGIKVISGAGFKGAKFDRAQVEGEDWLKVKGPFVSSSVHGQVSYTFTPILLSDKPKLMAALYISIGMASIVSVLGSCVLLKLFAMALVEVSSSSVHVNRYKEQFEVTQGRNDIAVGLDFEDEQDLGAGAKSTTFVLDIAWEAVEEATKVISRRSTKMAQSQSCCWCCPRRSHEDQQDAGKDPGNSLTVNVSEELGKALDKTKKEGLDISTLTPQQVGMMGPQKFFGQLMPILLRRLPPPFALVDHVSMNFTRQLENSLDEFLSIENVVLKVTSAEMNAMPAETRPDTVCCIDKLQEPYSAFCFLQRRPEIPLTQEEAEKVFSRWGFKLGPMPDERLPEIFTKIKFKIEEELRAQRPVRKPGEGSLQFFVRLRFVKTAFDADTVEVAQFEQLYQDFCKQKRIELQSNVRGQMMQMVSALARSRNTSFRRILHF